MKRVQSKTSQSTTKTSLKVVERPVQNKFNYEFGGPIGVGMVMLLMPLTVLTLYGICAKQYCLSASNLSNVWDENNFVTHDGSKDVSTKGLLQNYVTLEAFAVLSGWFLFQVVLERIVPGQYVQGVQLQNGQRLPYKINGHSCFWITWVVVFGGAYFVDPEQFGMGLLSYMYDQYIQLAVASIIFAISLSIFVFLYSFRGPETVLAHQGQSPNKFYNYFMGRELNPRIGATFDLKYFCELRPGLIGWAILNIGMMAKQYTLYGNVSYSMFFVCLFQIIYVWDALYHEKCVLTTMDITTDGFGYMLCFGDLSWVPFTYTLQARFLIDHDPQLSLLTILCLVVSNLIGYLIFRFANGQKDLFRTDPNHHHVQHLKYLTTARGSKLLITGWWGLARKINYTGDYLMGVTWCAFCGIESIVPYFYAIYFIILLTHRAFRDNEMCFQKYGKDWILYKEKVPYIFIPGII